MTYPDALEAFNRATHENALREMKIAPAEALQADERPTPRSVLATIPARDFFAAVGIAVTLWMVAAAVSVVVR